MEASGTSGMKAGFNGVINLSVLDGWWGEGYRGDNGWAIKPASEKLDDEKRAQEESRSLYEILQDRVIPLYYDRGAMGFSPEWVKMAKRSIMTLLPQFNSERMVGEYLSRFYIPASQRHHRFDENGFQLARELAHWKKRVRDAWPKVSLRAADLPGRQAQFGQKVRFSASVQLDGLDPQDVQVELLVGDSIRELRLRRPPEIYRLHPEGGKEASGEQRYGIELAPELCGRLEYRIRAYPYHAALSHPFQMGLMKWI